MESWSRRVTLLSALTLALNACSNAAPPLPRLTIDPDRVAVAGLSSGAYMATQAHLAFSDHLRGAALLAGGPYACAGGDLNAALSTCMTAKPAAPDVAKLAAEAHARADAGLIAPLSGLQDDAVWVWHGRHDAVVAEAVSHASVDLYRALGVSEPVWDGARDIGHGFPVTTAAGDCSTPEKPYLAACDFDAAGALIKALFGVPLHAENTVPAGDLQTFDQHALYAADTPDPLLADSGYLYLPKSCAAGKPCGLLIAFHGCEQNADNVGEAFVRGNGLNAWADRFDLVVLYPQTEASLLPLNPKACWDWWGYTGANYDTREGAQLRWLNAAAAALGVPLQ